MEFHKLQKHEQINTIDLNLQINNYNLITQKTINPKSTSSFSNAFEKWTKIVAEIEESAKSTFRDNAIKLDALQQENHFINNYLPWRIKILNERFTDIINLFSNLINKTQTANPANISENPYLEPASADSARLSHSTESIRKSKDITRVILFYDDNSFHTYEPES